MSSRRGALLAFWAFGAFWGGWAALLPRVQEAVGASQAELGFALLCIAAAAIPAMALAGLAIDRFGSRVLPLALLAFAGTAFLPALPASVPALGAALLILGAASGAVDVAINAEVAAIEARTGTRLMQLAHALFSAGVVSGAVAVGAARQAGAGRVPILAGLGVVLALTAMANRRPGPIPRRRSRRPRRIRPELVALGAVCAAAFWIEGGIEGWSALYLERVLDAPPLASALAPGLYATAMFAGRLSGDRSSARLGDRRLLALGGAVAAAGLVVASRAGVVPLALAAFFVAGAGVSVAAPILFGAAGRGAPEDERGSAVATVTTIAYLGFLVGPPVVGAVASAIGLRAAFGLLAAMGAVIAATAPRLRLS